MRQFLLKFLIGIVVLVCVCTSCLNNNKSNTTVSSDPTILSMRFSANDSFPGLNSASFTVLLKYMGDTGLIYNKDSILFGTPIDKVVPVFSYAYTPYSLQFHIANDTVDTFFMFTSKDTIDFNLQPMYVTVTAQDRVTRKTYAIKAVVHQSDPDLFVWERVNNDVFGKPVAKQRVLPYGNEFYWVASDGNANYCYKSSDGSVWSDVAVNQSFDIFRYLSSGDELFYVDSARVRISDNMLSWSDFGSPLPDGYYFSHPLLCYDDMVWALVSKPAEPESYKYLAAVSVDSVYILQDKLPDDFPVEGFAVTTFKSVTGRPRAVIIGGYADDGSMLDSRWNIERTFTGYNVIDFSRESSSSFSPVAGASAVFYGKKIYLFGGIDKDNVILTNQMRISSDEGITWSLPDTAHNKLPDSFKARYNQSVIVTEIGDLFIFGGRTRSEILCDVYKGQLNSVKWSLGN